MNEKVIFFKILSVFKQYKDWNYILTKTKMDNEWGRCSCGVMVKAIDYGIVVSDFVLQSHYYVHFRANTLGKGMNPLSSQLWVK